MALKVAQGARTDLANLDLGLIERSNIRQQQAYDKVAALQAQQLAQAGAQATLDPIAKEQALQEQKSAYDNLFRKAQGNLGKYASDFMQQAAANQAHQFNSLNKLQLEEFKRERDAVAKYGDRAIRKSNVGAMSLLKEDGSFRRSPEDMTALQADVRQADDYTKKAQDLGKWIEKSVEQGGMFRDSRFAHILSRKTIKEFTDKELIDFVNDPAVREAFLRDSTAMVDNRSQVGYGVDEEGKEHNMFTINKEYDPKGQLDSRFEDGTAQFLYGALKQKTLDRSVTYTDRTDQLALYEAKARKAAKVRQEAIDNAPTYSSTWASRGGANNPLEDIKYDEQGKVAKREGALFGLGYATGAAGVNPYDSSKKREDEKAANLIKNFRSAFPNSEGATDKQIGDAVGKYFQKLGAMEVASFNTGEGHRKSVEDLLNSEYGKFTFSGGGKTFNLGSEEGWEYLESLGGPADYNKLKKVSPKGFQLGTMSTMDTGGGKDVAGGLPFNLQIPRADGEGTVNLQVSSNEEMNKLGRGLSLIPRKIVDPNTGELGLVDEVRYVADGGRNPVKRDGRVMSFADITETGEIETINFVTPGNTFKYKGETINLPATDGLSGDRKKRAEKAKARKLREIHGDATMRAKEQGISTEQYLYEQSGGAIRQQSMAARMSEVKREAMRASLFTRGESISVESASQLIGGL